MNRMKGLLATFFAVSVVQMSVGSIADTNLAVRTLGEYIMLVDSAVEDETRLSDGVSTNEEMLTEEKVFSVLTLPGWAATENRLAVDSFFSNLTLLNEEKNANAACALLDFLADVGNTNAFGYAKHVIASTNTICRAVAWSVYLQHVHPSISENAFVERALCDELSMLEPGVKGDIYLKYGAKLMSLDLASDWCTLTNGACIFYRGVTNRIGAVQVDGLLTSLYPQYVNSSNRLALAKMALSDVERCRSNCQAVTSMWGVIRVEGAGLNDICSPLMNYFAPITNRLMSIQGPLPEVEELRR